jgi:putative DNA primase/helicase
MLMSDGAEDDPFAPLSPAQRRMQSAGQTLWTPIVPVPRNAPPAPARHPSLGEPAKAWTYRGPKGELLGYFCRFATTDGKETRPLTFCKQPGRRKPEWRWQTWAQPRPLYGLDRLAERPDAPVLVAEGEKSADAAAVLLPDLVAVASSGGSNSAGRADWSALAGRDIIMWPDGDLAGASYADAAAAVINKAGAKSIAIIDPPNGFAVVAKRPEPGKEKQIDWSPLAGRAVVVWPDAGDRVYADAVAKEIEKAGAQSVEVSNRSDGAIEGWDAADAANEGWTEARARELVDGARPYVANGGARGLTARRRASPTQKDILSKITQNLELWHDPSRLPCVSLTVEGRSAQGDRPAVTAHREHWPINSLFFRDWLSYEFFKATDAVPTATALADVTRVLQARAVNEGNQHATAVRVGELAGKVYLDLCDADWRAVEIGRHGWQVVASSSIKFLRSPSMLALPEPELVDDARSPIEDLRQFANTRSDDDFIMLIGFLISALRPPSVPYPILSVDGEHGTGKSNMCATFRDLVDPNEAPIRAAPPDAHNLFLSASNSHLQIFDNLSRLEPWFSDALCQVSSGGGFAKRQNYADREETIFRVRKPVILNGIPFLADRPDLADRTIGVTLSPILASARRPEVELWRAFHGARPRILGHLCTAVSCAVGRIDQVSLPELPRMADSLLWMTAAAPAFNWPESVFVEAYARNQRAVIAEAYDAHPITGALSTFMVGHPYPSGWEGSAAELLPGLNGCVKEPVQQLKSWPTTPQRLGQALRRVAPLMRKFKGFSIDQSRGEQRNWRIIPPAPASTSSGG